MKQVAKPILYLKTFLLSTVLLTLLSCNTKQEKEISTIPMDFELHRFDKAFAEAGLEDLQDIKQAYPLFFSSEIPDAFWIEKLQDSLQIELEGEVLKAFPEDKELYETVKGVFQHAKHYFPDFQPLKVYTSTTDVAYNHKVMINADEMVIGLDNYLGEGHYFYEGLQLYLTQNMNAARIPVDVATEIATYYVAPVQDRTFLSQIIYYGKLLYMAEMWTPKTPENVIIGYTLDQAKWARENEEDVWRYFIEKELLYSTDSGLRPRFIDQAPFSKFYLELDNKSPGRMGTYMGWQIVTSYMKRNDVSMEELAILDADLIFKNSKYKPRKK